VTGGAGAEGVPVRHRGWLAVHVQLILQREMGLVGSWISKRRLLMVVTAVPSGGCLCVDAGRLSRLCGQQDGLRGRLSWCWSLCALA
jgi:hypothetical protein